MGVFGCTGVFGRMGVFRRTGVFGRMGVFDRTGVLGGMGVIGRMGVLGRALLTLPAPERPFDAARPLLRLYFVLYKLSQSHKKL
jgi:hypothetical protein